MAGKLTAEQRARRYAAKLEALCSRPQWRKSGKKVSASSHLLRPETPDTPARRWYLGEDGPLSKWFATKDEEQEDLASREQHGV